MIDDILKALSDFTDCHEVVTFLFIISLFIACIVLIAVTPIFALVLFIIVFLFFAILFITGVIQTMRENKRRN